MGGEIEGVREQSDCGLRRARGSPNRSTRETRGERDLNRDSIGARRSVSKPKHARDEGKERSIETQLERAGCSLSKEKRENRKRERERGFAEAGDARRGLGQG